MPDNLLQLTGQERALGKLKGLPMYVRRECGNGIHILQTHLRSLQFDSLMLLQISFKVRR